MPPVHESVSSQSVPSGFRAIVWRGIVVISSGGFRLFLTLEIARLACGGLVVLARHAQVACGLARSVKNCKISMAKIQNIDQSNHHQ